MKFNWGTGIVIVLILFLLTMAGFIFFAMNQDVNLVHKDYYEKGVDYTEQMNINRRSESFQEKVTVISETSGLTIAIDSSLATTIDSGKVALYRPSGKDFDLDFEITKNNPVVQIATDKLINGRYIAKVSWYSRGIKYEVDKQVIVKK